MIKRYKHINHRRETRIRAKIAQAGADHKLVVTRSNKYIYAQLVDLKSGKTITGLMAKDPTAAGKAIAEKAKKVKIGRLVFDRGAMKYHGQVKSLATAAREGGLKF
jgi:large subunit ribosomal protein L18